MPKLTLLQSCLVKLFLFFFLVCCLVCLQAVKLQVVLGSSCFAPFVLEDLSLQAPSFPSSVFFRLPWLKLSISNTRCPSALKLSIMQDVI